MSAQSRLLVLLLVVVALPFLPAWAVAVAVTILLVAAAAGSQERRTRLADAIYRIRWLLLAVAVVFLVFSPAPWSASLLLEAAWRCGVLVCAVAAVQLALHGLSTEALADGLTRLLRPLRWTRLPVATFARRLTLTLDAVPQVQALIAATPAPVSRGFVDRIAGRAAAVIEALE